MNIHIHYPPHGGSNQKTQFFDTCMKQVSNDLFVCIWEQLQQLSFLITSGGENSTCYLGYLYFVRIIIALPLTPLGQEILRSFDFRYTYPPAVS